PDELYQRGRAVGRAEEALVELGPNGGKGVGMRVPLAADVEYRLPPQQAVDLRCPDAGLFSPGHDPPLHRERVISGARFAGTSPFRIVVPVDEPDQRRVDLIKQSPDPVQPERLKTFNGRPSDAWRPAIQPRRKRPRHSSRRVFVHPAVLFESDS